MPVVLPQLQEPPGDGRVAAAMADALSAALRALPAALRSHARPVERFAASALMAAGSPPGLRLAASQLLALVPRAAGDAGAWGDLCQRLLTEAHRQLDVAFLGLEDPALVTSARATLKPGGMGLLGGAPGPPSAGPAAAAGAGGGAGGAAALARLGGLLDCLERLLTGAFPVAVPLPGGTVLALLRRVLAMDTAPVAEGRVPASASAYAELISALPALHAAALGLLQTLLAVGRGALAPLQGPACALACDLLRRLAAGGARTLVVAAWPVREQVHAFSADVLAAAVQSAALRLLEALLQAGGASLPAEQRARADALAAHAAATTAAAAERLAREAETGGRERAWASASAAYGGQGDPGGVGAPELRAAALRALAASVLAPAPHRPPFLPLALELFRQGLLALAPDVVAVSGRALAACEALLHPRLGGGYAAGESEDSEGPLPEIDSGLSSSDEESGIEE
ncbi:hypothetical protein WJX81_007774 [Elliptochloris bilobata]|uniref:Pre-rRNA-processing protein RIX1 N-terminal domain-containing protein n=1 Tax=Elliptochloris bilobata TaxID=381761 RepID=A0AAW1RKC9_9CHLO